MCFIKGDGCGEYGQKVLVDLAERRSAFVKFYRPPVSRYGKKLMRELRARGHGLSIEADITYTTYGRPVAELNGHWLPQIRD